MRRALVIGLLLGGTVAIAARPVSELQLWTQLDGQPMRWVMPDGGFSGLFSTQLMCTTLGGTIGTGTHATSFTPNVVLLVPSWSQHNVCIRPQVNANGVALYWDGGCNLVETDENFGTPMAAWQPQYVIPHPKATTICAVSDAGTVRVPMFSMQ